MIRRYYYKTHLLLWSLFAAQLYAAQGSIRDPEAQAYAHRYSAYTHGALTFIAQEKDKVHKKKLKKGLIDLSQRIKAKGGQKVYFFIGASGAGKSLTIAALQGNKVQKTTQQSPSLAKNRSLYKQHSKKATHKVPFQITYVLPKHQVPVVGGSRRKSLRGTAIYYPSPEHQAHQQIAFADTACFLGKRKVTSTDKCLAVVSFFYALKVNSVGGLILVISKPKLDRNMGKIVLQRFAHILHTYFPDAFGNQTIKKSFLVMITQAPGKQNKKSALGKLIRCIQQAYQAYYADPGDPDNQCLKLFCEMLLARDVPKADIHNMKKFKIADKQFCYPAVYDRKRTQQRILDKQVLAELRPIDPRHLSAFDNPLSQYVRTTLIRLSKKLNLSLSPLLALKQNIAEREQKIEQEIKARGLTITYQKLREQRKEDTETWQVDRELHISTWGDTAHMLQFFADEILQDGADKALIKAHLKNFGEATQLQPFCPLSKVQPNKQILAKQAEDIPYKGTYAPDKWAVGLIGSLLIVSLLLLWSQLSADGLQALQSTLLHKWLNIST